MLGVESSGAFGTSSELVRALTGGQKFMKYIIMALAFLYFIFGCVLCGMGATAMDKQASQLTSTLPKGLIAVGVFLIITSLIGAFSAWREFRLGLGIYFALLLIWSIILVSIGIAVVAQSDTASLQRWMASGWDAADPSVRSEIQKDWNCCGRNNANEKDDSGQFTAVSDGCRNNTNPNADLAAEPYNPDQSGCVPVLIQSFQSNAKPAGIAGIVFAVIMAIGLAFTIFLMRGIKDRGYAKAIDRNRQRTERDKAQRRARGKGGLKIPDNVL